LQGVTTPKKYINLTEPCGQCSNLSNEPYNLNIYDFELALMQRELDLLRDLVATKDELIVALKTKLNN